MAGFLDELKHAQQMRLYVGMTMLNGSHWLAAVRAVDDKDRTASLYDSQATEDPSPQLRRIQVDDISELEVTEMNHVFGHAP